VNYKQLQKLCLTVRKSPATLGGGIYSKNHSEQKKEPFYTRKQF